MKFLNSCMIVTIICDILIGIISLYYLASNFNYNEFDESAWIRYQQFNATLTVSYFSTNNLYASVLLLHLSTVLGVRKISWFYNTMPNIYISMIYFTIKLILQLFCTLQLFFVGMFSLCALFMALALCCCSILCRCCNIFARDDYDMFAAPTIFILLFFQYFVFVGFDIVNGYMWITASFRQTCAWNVCYHNDLFSPNFNGDNSQQWQQTMVWINYFFN